MKDVRRFAVEDLGLAENRNYTTFKRTPSDHLATVVSACPADSFRQYKWSYFVMGDMPYKGFFDRQGALDEAERLEKEGYDVLVRDVDAFSTLGVFPDPVFSYMKRYPVFSLAEILIHEQTHATVFPRAYVDFAENFADFVGERGALEYLRRRDGEEGPAFRGSLDLLHDQAVYNGLLRDLRDRLDGVYRTDAPRDEKLAAKAAIIASWKVAFAGSQEALFRTRRYAFVPKSKIDNAYLCTVMNYVGDRDLFDRLFEREGRDLARTIAAVKEMAAGAGDPLACLREYLGGP